VILPLRKIIFGFIYSLRRGDKNVLHIVYIIKQSLCQRWGYLFRYWYSW